MDIEPWLGTAAIVGTVLGTAVAGIFGGKKLATKDEAQSDTRVLAASIVPHSEMKALTEATVALVPPIKRLVTLLEMQAHQRELEAEVRQVLKDRGLE